MIINESIKKKIEQNGLNRIETFSLVYKEKTQTITKPEEIFSCLQLVEKTSIGVDFTLIKNELYKSHLVCLNNTEPIVCLGYGDIGEYEAFIPIFPISSEGENYKMFTYKYILFFKNSLFETLTAN